MKKKVSITIDEEIWEFMQKNYTNKSGLVTSLIKKHYTENGINNPKEEVLTKEESLILNG